jgi:monofunctional biosynthetic peptidoglycan transglycosylase
VRFLVSHPWVHRAVLALLVVLGLRAQWVVLHVAWWRFFDPAETAFMDARADELEEKGARIKHKPVPLERISPHLLKSLIAAEDARFRHHGGFDLDGILDAAEKNVRARRIKAGGSTITQQLAKNLFLSPRRSFVRKAEEALITLTLELLWDKRRILEVYANVIEWGDGVFGAEAAARRYFGTSAASLTREQAAWLAAIVPSPRRYERDRGNASVQAKAARIQASIDLLELP